MNFLRRLRGLTGPAILMMAALIALVPLLLRGPSCYGDLLFHYISWIDAEHSMSTGLLYPHWSNSPNFGAGQPEFVFYPPISWMAGAILGMFVPWSLVPIALFILLLSATGLANRALAKEVLGEQAATLAGCASIFLGYVLFNVYRRNDFAELTGGFWIPLLLLFALRRRNPSGSLWERTFDGSAAPLALVVAGAWLSNGPLGIMSTYLLAAIAVVSALTERSFVPVLRAAVGTAGGMCLASLYLIPAVAERNWVNLQNALDPNDYAIENSWLFAHHANPVMASHDRFLHQVSWVAVAMLMITFAGAGIAWIRGVVPGQRRWWLPMAVIAPAVLFMLLPISQPVWSVLPELRLLQFPWRWLVVLEAPMAIWFASAVWVERKTARIAVISGCAVVFMGIGLLVPRWWWVECQSFVTSIEQAVAAGSLIVPGKPEYAPPGIRFSVLNVLVDEKENPLVDPLGKPVLDSAGNALLNSLAHPNVQHLPDACLLETAATTPADFAPAWRGGSEDCDSSGWQQFVLSTGATAAETPNYLPEQKYFTGVARHAGYVILRLRYFPAWSVKVNGSPVTAVAERERGLMAVPVPRGIVQVSVDWKTTGDVVAGRLVSGIALILLICLHLFERKQVRAGSRVPVEKSKLDTRSERSARPNRKKRRNSASRNSSKTPSGR